TMLTISVLAAQPSPQTASPGITFRLRIEELSGARIHTVALRCQVQIPARSRRYMQDEQDRLYELFGNASEWDRTLRTVTWGQTPLVIPSFDRRIDIDLPVPCTYDLQVAAAKYLHAIRDRHVPLTFLFSGMMFRVTDRGLHVEPVPWDLETSYQMPAR